MPKILVIEDEPTVRQNVVRLLEAEGFAVLNAASGIEGLALAQQHLPDLVICDITMPDLNGYEVLHQLRQHPIGAITPFIFLSARADRTDFRQGMQLGADDYLTKPFTRAELLGAIASRLQKQTAVTQLQKKIHELQQVNFLKDDLINTVSHDLRAPLTNIRMLIEMMNLDLTEEQRQFYMGMLNVECMRELELINDLLDLQRLEARVPLCLETLTLSNWLPELLEPFKLRAQTRQQILKVEMSPALLPICSEPSSLRRIVTELLNNACKYTPAAGQILLKVEPAAIATAQPENHASSSDPVLDAADSDPTEAALRPASVQANTTPQSGCAITVMNEAEIPPTALPHIFERFYRAPAGDRWQQGGTGLGLSLVQKLVERLAGTIAVQSDRGWTVFTVRFPATALPPAPPDEV
jgi:two-component system, sensor histidine kinase and response regulator